MSRKHYEAIAASLRDANAPADLIRALAMIFYEDNRLFNMPRFLAAAGLAEPPGSLRSPD